jgi:hypothetical protein
MNRVLRTGNLVSPVISGRVAVKQDGMLTGEWANFEQGEMGTVIRVHRRDNRRQTYVVSFGRHRKAVEFLAKHLERIDDVDV